MHLLEYQFDSNDELDVHLVLDVPQESIGGKYLILSHRWGPAAEEVTFDDMIAGRAKRKKAYSKIEGFCRTARATNPEIKYLWCDTCCINKASSAELSESIVSMYRYYRDAACCYVYLHDCVDIDFKGPESSFRRSAWFTRGWTLQELLAPSRLHFYTHEWKSIGRLLGTSANELWSVIEDITRIPHGAFLYKAGGKYCAATKMSWAARRKTTRIEDQAYCLMGLFRVYITPLYGEGDNAFIRLQEEIIRTTSDQSIFAWTNRRSGFSNCSSMLAVSPANFATARRDGKLLPQDIVLEHAEYRLINIGLAIRLPLIRIEGFAGICAAVLDCKYLDPSEYRFSYDELLNGRTNTRRPVCITYCHAYRKGDTAFLLRFDGQLGDARWTPWLSDEIMEVESRLTTIVSPSLLPMGLFRSRSTRDKPIGLEIGPCSPGGRLNKRWVWGTYVSVVYGCGGLASFYSERYGLGLAAENIDTCHPRLVPFGSYRNAATQPEWYSRPGCMMPRVQGDDIALLCIQPEEYVSVFIVSLNLEGPRPTEPDAHLLINVGTFDETPWFSVGLICPDPTMPRTFSTCVLQTVTKLDVAQFKFLYIRQLVQSSMKDRDPCPIDSENPLLKTSLMMKCYPADESLGLGYVVQVYLHGGCAPLVTDAQASSLGLESPKLSEDEERLLQYYHELYRAV